MARGRASCGQNGKDRRYGFYVSPLGRAQDTASVTLKRLGRSAKTYHWLREFHAPIYDKKTKKLRGPWDLMPSFFTKEDDLYDVKNGRTQSL